MTGAGVIGCMRIGVVPPVRTWVPAPVGPQQTLGRRLLALVPGDDADLPSLAEQIIRDPRQRPLEQLLSGRSGASYRPIDISGESARASACMGSALQTDSSVVNRASCYDRICGRVIQTTSCGKLIKQPGLTAIGTRRPQASVVLQRFTQLLRAQIVLELECRAATARRAFFHFGRISSSTCHDSGLSCFVAGRVTCRPVRAARRREKRRACPPKGQCAAHPQAPDNDLASGRCSGQLVPFP